MTDAIPENASILAIALSSEGFGFAVIEGKDTLIDWAVTYATGDKNGAAIAKVKKLLEHYKPFAIVLEDSIASGTRRSCRIRTLVKRIVAAAEAQNVKAVMLSRQLIRRNLSGDSLGNKDDLAALVAERFPEELAHRLPPKRKPWNSQDHRMLIFDAVAVGLAFGKQNLAGSHGLFPVF